MQVGAAPAQRIQAAQHVVADRDVDCTQLERVELEGLAVVGGGQNRAMRWIWPESRSSASLSSRAKAWAPVRVLRRERASQ
jgi:hypothetical protein